MHKPNESFAMSKFVLCLMISLLILSNCGKQEVATLPTSTLSVSTFGKDVWGTNWIKGLPCKPPCWYGITPGQTTETDAINILKSLPFVNTSSITTTYLLQGSYASWLIDR